MLTPTEKDEMQAAAIAIEAMFQRAGLPPDPTAPIIPMLIRSGRHSVAPPTGPQPIATASPPS